MKKKQTVRDISDKSYFDVLVISSNGRVLDRRTMDGEAQIFDGLLDLKVKNVSSEVCREYCSWDDNEGFREKTLEELKETHPHATVTLLDCHI